MKLLKVAISTVGCRANQADSAALLRWLNPERVVFSPELEGADVVIINTCTVTAEADRDCRKRARRALDAAPGARVFLVGCAVNVDGYFGEGIDARVETLTGEDGFPQSVARRLNAMAGSNAGEIDAVGLPDRLSGRTRGLLKVQNGCSHGCSYCIVPKARGRERSMAEAEVFQELDRLKDSGFLEVVITGVQLGAWGKDIGRPGGLGGLLARAADRFSPGRLRISSLEPWSVDDAFLETVLQHDRICAHLHLPLQHGDDDILRAMRRGYDGAFYLNIVEKIRRLNPDAALGTDVIFGFPGEDDRAFRYTLQLLQEISPAYLHAFTFSPRKGTRAVELPDRPGKDVARYRTGEARALGEACSLSFRNTQIGKLREVIVEEEKDGLFFGLTDNFVRTRIIGNASPPGGLSTVRIVSAEKDGVRAEC